MRLAQLPPARLPPPRVRSLDVIWVRPTFRLRFARVPVVKSPEFLYIVQKEILRLSSHDHLDVSIVGSNKHLADSRNSFAHDVPAIAEQKCA
jgi:hypothetical protein